MLWTKIKKLLLSRFHPELWRGAHPRDWVWSEDFEQATILSTFIISINLISIMVNMLIITTIISINIIVNMLMLQEGEQWTSVQSQLSLSISGSLDQSSLFQKILPHVIVCLSLLPPFPHLLQIKDHGHHHNRHFPAPDSLPLLHLRNARLPELGTGRACFRQVWHSLRTDG